MPRSLESLNEKHVLLNSYFKVIYYDDSLMTWVNPFKLKVSIDNAINFILIFRIVASFSTMMKSNKADERFFSDVIDD